MATYNGNNGDDTLAGTIDYDQYNLGEGNNNVKDLIGNNTFNAGSGNDSVESGTGNDTFNLGEGANTVKDTGGNNIVNTGSGADNITTGDGDDQINAGGGDNTIYAGAGTNRINTGSGADHITSGNGNDDINAGDGNNWIDAGAGTNRVTTGAGADTINTGDGNDDIYAGEGNNTVNAGGGINHIYTGSGIDIIKVGSGDSTIYSGGGADDISIGGGRALVYAGEGNDTVRVVADGVYKELWGEGGSDTLEITLTAQQARNAAVIADINGFKANKDWTYTFSSLNITARQFENIVIKAPVEAAADRAETDEDSSVVVDVLKNDIDLLAPNNSALHVVAVTQPSGGAVTISSDGKTVSFDPGSSFQHLNAGEHADVTFTYRVADDQGFSDVQTVTVRVCGLNDTASISGAKAGSVAEDGIQSAGGTLLVSDVDDGQNAFAVVPVNALHATYGDFTFDAASGHWSFVIDNAKAQELTSHDHIAQTLTVHSLDGTASEVITVTVDGADDAAVIGGDKAGAGSEDDQDPITGTLTVSDKDAGQSSLQAGETKSDIGTFTVGADGKWNFTIDNAAVQHLGAHASASQDFTVRAFDGTTGTVHVTVNGSNDEASITGQSTGSVTEDGNPQTVGGKLSVSDVDDGENVLVSQPNVLKDYGTFHVGPDGTWSFDLDNTAAQSLKAGDHVEQKITVASADGTAHQDIIVTVNGVDDPAVIGGTKSGTVTEDTQPSVSGAMTVSDKDAGQSSFQSQTTHNDLGTFHLDTDGSWSFVLDNSAAVQGLTANDHLVREFTVQSADGTTDKVSVTINGSNDLASISGTGTGSVTEDANPQPQIASGKLSVSDADFGEKVFQSVASADLHKQYGDFTFNASTGDWTFQLNNTAAQILKSTDHIDQSLTVKSLDGTASQTIHVTVNGVDEVPTGNPGSFENGVVNGKFDGWTGTAGVSIYNASSAPFIPYLATDGTHSLMISGSGQSPQNLKTFLGLPDTAIFDQMADDGNSRTNDNAQNGEAAKIIVHLEKNQTFHFDWLFDGTEISHNDFAFMLRNGVATKLADIGDVGFGNSGWQHAQYTNTGNAADFTFAVVSENEGNSGGSSPRLFIDHVYIA